MSSTIRGLITLNVLLLFLSNCSTAQLAPPPAGALVFVGSTPGDTLVKQLLAIPIETEIDFIRWRLNLDANSAQTSGFTLQLQYGLSQPNTLGFQHDGQSKTITGHYKIENNPDQGKRVYYFTSDNLPHDIAAVELGDNLLHLMGTDKQLLIGNGGWSYTLNRQEPVRSEKKGLPLHPPAADLLRDTASQLVFTGRTPSADIAQLCQLTLAAGAFKLKWKITLHKDPVTHEPTFYQMRRIDRRATEMQGKWTILRGTPDNPEAVIYQLDLEQPDKSIYLWAGSEALLFFMDKEGHLLTGNGDFSYTLNKAGGTN